MQSEGFSENTVNDYTNSKISAGNSHSLCYEAGNKSSKLRSLNKDIDK